MASDSDAIDAATPPWASAILMRLDALETAVTALRPPERKPRPRSTGTNTKDPLTVAQQAAVLRCAREFYSGPDAAKRPGATLGITGERLYGWVYLSIHTGWHLAVTTDPVAYRMRVDGDSRMILWDRTKRSEIASPMSTEVILEKDRAWVPDWVRWFRDELGGIKDRMTIARICWLLGEDAALPQKLSTMTFRHTKGMMMAKARLSAAAIAERLNCSVVVATKVYARYRDDKELVSGGYAGPGEEFTTGA